MTTPPKRPSRYGSDGRAITRGRRCHYYYIPPHTSTRSVRLHNHMHNNSLGTTFLYGSEGRAITRSLRCDYYYIPPHSSTRSVRLHNHMHNNSLGTTFLYGSEGRAITRSLRCDHYYIHRSGPLNHDHAQAPNHRRTRAAVPFSQIRFPYWR